MNRQTRSRPPRAALTLFCVCLGLVLLAPARSARAQTSTPPHDTSIDTQLFQPAIGPYNFLTVEGADVPDHKRLSFGLDAQLPAAPLLGLHPGIGVVPSETHIVDDQLTSEIDAAIGLFGRYQVGLGIPFTFFLDGDEVDAMGAPANLHLRQTGIGDIRIEGKAHLATLGSDDQYDLGLSAGLTLPTGHTRRPRLPRRRDGDGANQGDRRRSTSVPLRAAGNLGILIRETSNAFATDLGPQLLYGAAADYTFDRKTDVILEIAGRSGLNQFIQFYSDVNPFEVDRRRAAGHQRDVVGDRRRRAGDRQRHRRAGHPALPDGRLQPRLPRPRPRRHLRHRRQVPRPARGSRRLPGRRTAVPIPTTTTTASPTSQDKCPNDAEDVDDFQDDDGCPDLDNDNDGIPDLNDACPNAPEDHKGKKPERRLPVDPPRTATATASPTTSTSAPTSPRTRTASRTPTAAPIPTTTATASPTTSTTARTRPEDADGFQDEDGCPDPDNDKDGIPDAVDKCPLQPETLNGIQGRRRLPRPGPRVGAARRGEDRGRREARLRQPRRQDHAARIVGQGGQRRRPGDEGAPGDRRSCGSRSTRPASRRRRRRSGPMPCATSWSARGSTPRRIEAVGMGAGATRIDFNITIGEPPKPGAAAKRPGARRQAPWRAAAAADAARDAPARARCDGPRQALMRIIGWGASDVGRKRAHNEDSFLCNNDLRLYAVADGMGGHLGGERASRMAVEILEREIGERPQAGLLATAPEPATTGATAPGQRALAARGGRGRSEHLRGGDGQPGAVGDGDDADRAALLGRLRAPRPRGRLARLPLPRRARAPADRGPLLDPGAGARRPHLARGGQGVALPQHHHPLGRLRAERRARSGRHRRPGGRLLRPLLRRPLELPDASTSSARC